MSPRHLKSLVQAGHYRPEPALVAEAMLQRRGVRLLLGERPVTAVDRTRVARSAHRPAI
jgi:hypothetical protein